MKELKYSEILARNRELGNSLTEAPYRIALLSNVVMNQMGEVLEFSLRRQGIRAEVTIGEYDNIVQDSERFKGVDAAVVFWEASNLVEGFHVIADTMSGVELSALAERVEGELALVLQNLKHVPLVLFNRFSSLIFSANDLRRGGLAGLCDHLNIYLDQEVATNQVAVDIDKVLAKVGLDSATDFRQFQSTKALYSIDFLKSYTEYVEPAFRAATGRGRKVLILDCDNTLWGGILGEDGESRIQMSDTTRQGRIFREVQCLLRGLQQRGILLALCSKNDPEDVDSILSNHADMVLRDVNIVAKKVNWCDKATNIRQLAQDLNLGLDSFVFLDDSAFELGLVEEALPQVHCFKVPEVLSEYPALIRRMGREFFMFSATAEDAVKTAMYQQEQERKGAISRFESVEDYLKSLELRIRVDWGAEVPVSRAAQLSQKTNQFNLTTRRYTEADIQRMLDDGEHLVATFAVSDRFGDYGVAGLLIIRQAPKTAVAFIDTLLMSCRVLGRNIEHALFNYLMGKFSERGVNRILAEYIRTPKNDQVAQFYDALGFNLLNEDGICQKYELTASDYQPTKIDYIEVIDND